MNELEVAGVGDPVDKIGKRQLLLIQQFELQQHLDCVVRMSVRALDKGVEARARVGQHLGAVAEYRAVARNDSARVKPLDQVEGGGHFVECGVALKLRKHHAEAFFPQGICRDQGLGLRLKQND